LIFNRLLPLRRRALYWVPVGLLWVAGVAGCTGMNAMLHAKWAGVGNADAVTETVSAEDASLEPRQFTDRRTAVTVTGAAEPLVVGHEEPSLAANARDYLSLGAIAVNHIGDYDYYLVVVAWTTIDRGRIRGADTHLEVPAKLVLRLDKTPFTLVAVDGLDPVRDRELYPPPAGSGVRRYFPLPVTLFRAMTTARQVRVEVERAPAGRAVYTPWGTRGVEALRQLSMTLTE
jgi:hypothetical protein